ncbi:3-methyladenine DNA glycosylase [Marinococcus halophilus]|uniref:DNA-3-methyladenine glycosylase I n=1 Tax=Marinococcus halophilus TaxID=1371 RepID=A0A510Y4E2_MARHA|nr:DNA-3-methyladenine glycosylase I [Marinococcus halophilus]OZT80143.1 3-methyladenine DNA glycosylase [Marinococcus halophilus]GEK58192.1 DNA-3-methyladenine glycosylase I [Marinococcus halophilus]
MEQCLWPQNSELLQTYHDEEWCRPSRDDRYIFEMLTLEGAQAGLSWSIVLARREAYRSAFNNYDLEYCAGLTDTDLEAIKENYQVIKHFSKLQSVRSNAEAVLKIQNEFGSLADFLWSYVDFKPMINSWTADTEIPAQSPLSVRISKNLKKRGFKFIGPVITYSFLQAIGMVDDHITSCRFHTSNID